MKAFPGGPTHEAAIDLPIEIRNQVVRLDLEPEAGAAGMPGVPLAGAGQGRNYGFAAPRYGFKPTVMARPVVAG